MAYFIVDSQAWRHPHQPGATILASEDPIWRKSFPQNSSGGRPTSTSACMWGGVRQAVYPRRDRNFYANPASHSPGSHARSRTTSFGVTPGRFRLSPSACQNRRVGSPRADNAAWSASQGRVNRHHAGSGQDQCCRPILTHHLPGWRPTDLGCLAGPTSTNTRAPPVADGGTAVREPRPSR